MSNIDQTPEFDWHAAAKMQAVEGSLEVSQAFGMLALVAAIKDMTAAVDRLGRAMEGQRPPE